MSARLLLSYGNADGGEPRALGKERQTRRNAARLAQVCGLKPRRTHLNFEWLFPFEAACSAGSKQQAACRRHTEVPAQLARNLDCSGVATGVPGTPKIK